MSSGAGWPALGRRRARCPDGSMVSLARTRVAMETPVTWPIVRRRLRVLCQLRTRIHRLLPLGGFRHSRRCLRLRRHGYVRGRPGRDDGVDPRGSTWRRSDRATRGLHGSASCPKHVARVSVRTRSERLAPGKPVSPGLGSRRRAAVSARAPAASTCRRCPDRPGRDFGSSATSSVGTRLIRGCGELKGLGPERRVDPLRHRCSHPPADHGWAGTNQP